MVNQRYARPRSFPPSAEQQARSRASCASWRERNRLERFLDEGLLLASAIATARVKAAGTITYDDYDYDADERRADERS